MAAWLKRLLGIDGGRYTPKMEDGGLGPVAYFAAHIAIWSRNGKSVTVAGSFDARVVPGQVGILSRLLLDPPLPAKEICAGSVGVASVLQESGVIYAMPSPPKKIAIEFAPMNDQSRTYRYHFTYETP